MSIQKLLYPGHGPVCGARGWYLTKALNISRNIPVEEVMLVDIQEKPPCPSTEVTDSESRYLRRIIAEYVI